MAGQSNIDPKSLEKLTTLANEIGADGLWLIRGAKNAALLYDADDPTKPTSDPIVLELTDAPILLIARFPVSDGGEPGIESR